MLWFKFSPDLDIFQSSIIFTVINVELVVFKVWKQLRKIWINLVGKISPAMICWLQLTKGKFLNCMSWTIQMVLENFNVLTLETPVTASAWQPQFSHFESPPMKNGDRIHCTMHLRCQWVFTPQHTPITVSCCRVSIHLVNVLNYQCIC